jgi:hypothetical protein
MPYRPVACRHTYRLVIVRKNLVVNDPRQGRLFDDNYRYFLYLTNDRQSTPTEIVFSANDRPRRTAPLSLRSATASQSRIRIRLFKG